MPSSFAKRSLFGKGFAAKKCDSSLAFDSFPGVGPVKMLAFGSAKQVRRIRLPSIDIACLENQQEAVFQARHETI